MICSKCGRNLREDSNFCDNCGNPVINNKPQVKKEFNTQMLLIGIAASIIITLIISGLAGALGLPLVFGGLFLPFLWKAKKRD